MDAFRQRVLQKIEELRKRGEEARAKRLEGYLAHVDEVLSEGEPCTQ